MGRGRAEVCGTSTWSRGSAAPLSAARSWLVLKVHEMARERTPAGSGSVTTTSRADCAQR